MIAAAALALCAGVPAIAADGDPKVDALGWLDPAADPVESLTRLPSECIAMPADEASRRSIALGRIAFRSPRLLGGLAARRGMSCDACHRNGRDHPAFFIEGVSREPGTVDVTGGLFSRGRDDGEFNPVAIPTLVDVAEKSVFGTVRPSRSLASFVRSVVVDEFQGRIGSDAVDRGLLAYVRALRSSACPEASTEIGLLDRDLEEVRFGLELLEAFMLDGDRATADFLVAALRAVLGRIDQRIVADDDSRADLRTMSARLASLRNFSATAGITEWTASVEAARGAFAEIASQLRQRARNSLYDPRFARTSLSAARKP